MRISDWSSDVCSSELNLRRRCAPNLVQRRPFVTAAEARPNTDVLPFATQKSEVTSAASKYPPHDRQSRHRSSSRQHRGSPPVLHRRANDSARYTTRKHWRRFPPKRQKEHRKRVRLGTKGTAR